MSVRCFVDTNILVYAHDQGAGLKFERATILVEQLWSEMRGVISTQILQELYISLRRKVSRPLSVSEAQAVVRDFCAWDVIINNRESVLRAISLEARYQLSFWDGLILQAAQQAETELLYTEDLNHGQRYGTVQVINPFF